MKWTLVPMLRAFNSSMKRAPSIVSMSRFRRRKMVKTEIPLAQATIEKVT